MGKTIRGPFTISAGKELPAKVKEQLKKIGVKLPFSVEGFKYKNREVDDWLVVKEGDKRFSFDRKKDKFKEVK